MGGGGGFTVSGTEKPRVDPGFSNGEGGLKRLCHAAHIYNYGQGPGPWELYRVLRALPCSLSLILKLSDTKRDMIKKNPSRSIGSDTV